MNHNWIAPENIGQYERHYRTCSECGTKALFCGIICYYFGEDCNTVQNRLNFYREVAKTHTFVPINNRMIKCTKCGIETIRGRLGIPIVSQTCDEIIIKNIIK